MLSYIKKLKFMNGKLVILIALTFLSCNSATKDQEKKIIGNWVGDIKLPKTGKYVGKMYLQFTQKGEFFQKTGEGSEQVVSKMTYKLSKDKIFYKGKATSNEEFDSNYSFKGDTLVIEYEGEKAEYIRVK